MTTTGCPPSPRRQTIDTKSALPRHVFCETRRSFAGTVHGEGGGTRPRPVGGGARLATARRDAG